MKSKFCQSLKESRAIENIPANEPDLLLSKFIISVRKQNDTEYEPVVKVVTSGIKGCRRRYCFKAIVLSCQSN